jgi:hypothetical protein
MDLAWYTDNAPQNDAQVAAHFARQRPVLGICLKRYYMEPNGEPKRLNTFVDIPLEIALPHFVSDDCVDDDGPLFGNFKLSLQSVVCHRGVSVDSGHYISLVRGNMVYTRRSSDSGDVDEGPSRWLLFDDLAPERIKTVNVIDELKKESPYLLFYQVQPIDEDLAMGAPPPYSEKDSAPTTTAPSLESLLPRSSQSDVDPSIQESNKNSDTSLSTVATQPTSEAPITLTTAPTNDPVDLDASEATVKPFAPPSTTASARASLDIPRGRTSMSENRRNSVVFDDASIAGSSTRDHTGPTTPADERKSGFLGSRRGSRVGKNGKNTSRASSQNAENRLSATLTMLTARMSKDKLSGTQASDTTENGQPIISALTANGTHGDGVYQGSKTTEDVGRTSVSLNRSKSKKKKDKEKTPRALSRRPHNAERPDRECVIM